MARHPGRNAAPPELSPPGPFATRGCPRMLAAYPLFRAVRAEISKRVRTRSGRIRFHSVLLIKSHRLRLSQQHLRLTPNPGAPGIVGWLSKKTIACHGSVQHVVHKAAAVEPSASRHDDAPNRTTNRRPKKDSRPSRPLIPSPRLANGEQIVIVAAGPARSRILWISLSRRRRDTTIATPIRRMPRRVHGLRPLIPREFGKDHRDAPRRLYKRLRELCPTRTLISGR